jgi:putative DNA primase/helicase
VAEGIEDALSFMQMTGQPCWSAVVAGGIEQLILPPEVKFVAIAMDNDKRGLVAAQVAARRWLSEGRRVWFSRPPIGKDWNDTLRASARGVAA